MYDYHKIDSIHKSLLFFKQTCIDLVKNFLGIFLSKLLPGEGNNPTYKI